jgi:hypothetical protein
MGWDCLIVELLLGLFDGWVILVHINGLGLFVWSLLGLLDCWVISVTSHTIVS